MRPPKVGLTFSPPIKNKRRKGRGEEENEKRGVRQFLKQDRQGQGRDKVRLGAGRGRVRLEQAETGSG